MIKNIFQINGETFDDYAKRLYANKHIYELTNDEIGALLNKASGNDFDESAYRKKYMPYIRGYRDSLEDQVVILKDETERNKLIKEMYAIREENYKSEVRLRDKLRELRGYKRVEARAENLKQVMLEKISDVNKLSPLNLTKEEVQGDKIAVVQFSDWHYGEVIEDKLNEYNKEIFKMRLENIVNDIIKYGLENKIKTIKVLNLGDLISGNIRVSARVMNEEDVITQTIEVSEFLSQALENLSQYFYIEFYSVLDNHARVSSNYNEHIERESFARIVSWYIDARLQNNDRVEVKSNKINGFDEYDIGVLDIFDEKALFVHGHNDKLNSVIPDISMLTGIKPIAIFMGHLHRNIEDEEFEVDLIVNPSLIGLGAYAKSIRKSSKPRQKMTIYNKDGDKVFREATYYLQGEK